jgi:predicted ATPase
MAIEIQLRNYRCVPFRSPVNLRIERGITFLLGVNNVGKSTLLRMFFELRKAVEAVQNRTEAEQVELPTFWDSLKNQSSSEKQLTIGFADGKEKAELTIAPMLTTDDEHVNRYRVTWGEPGKPLLTNDTNLDARLMHQKLKRSELHSKVLDLFLSSMLVPPLRPVGGAGASQAGDIYVGQNLVSHFDNWATGDNKKRQVEMKELEADLAALFNYKEFRLQSTQNTSHFQVTNDDGIFRLTELGDGIGHFIVVLLNAVFRKPRFILVDEPENGLHPRMQQTFIRALAEKASYGLLAASHSVGLARSVAGQTYVVGRHGAGITLSPFGESHKPTIAQALHELGYSNFVDIGGSNVLLVEGRTDILSFREILRKFSADQHFIIWHLGGSDFINENVLEELGEVKRLNAKSVSVVFDSEREADGAPLKPKLQAFYDQCQKLQYIVHPTERHSTENYICQRALDEEFGAGKYTSLSPFESFNNLEPRWSKRQNWRLFSHMTNDELLATDLGKFVEATLLPAVTK